MLKNKLWIVALFAALTMAFIGCTDAARDWEEPLEAFEENVLQVKPLANWSGFDLNHPAFNFRAGDVIQMTGKTIAENQIVLTAAPPNWTPYVWQTTTKLAADTEFDTGKVALTQAMVDSINSSNPKAIRFRGNFANGTVVIYNITVTRGTNEIFNLKEMVLNKLEPGEKDYKKIFGTFDGDFNDKSVQWISEASSDGTAAEFMILGPGIGGEAPPEVPSYAGDPDKVRYVNATGDVQTVATAIIVDFDPSITGDAGNENTAIDKDGWASVGENSVLFYKFPESVYLSGAGVRRLAEDVNIGADWDYVELEAEVRNAVTTSGGDGNFKARFMNYINDAAYKLATDANNSEYKDFGSATNPKKVKVQTWAAGSSGGIAIRFNYGDRATSGADSLEAKITKVTFTKGTRHTVRFLSPQTGTSISDITVLDGNPIGSNRLPNPSNPGWQFFGWYDEWTLTGNAAGNTIIDVAHTGDFAGTKVKFDTLIETGAFDKGLPAVAVGTTAAKPLILYAAWLQRILPPITVDAPANGTLLAGKLYVSGSWSPGPIEEISNSATVSHDGKTWNVFYPFDPAGTANYDLGPWTIGTTTIPAQVDGTPTYNYTLPSGWNDGYNKMKITYDLLLVDPENKSAVVALTNGDAWSGGSAALPNLENGNGKELILNVSDLTAVIGFRVWRYYGGGLGTFLWRISKVEFYVE